MERQTHLFFTIFRNTYLKQKIFLLFFYDFYKIKDIPQLDKQYNLLSLLKRFNIPVVYDIQNIDHYHIYNAHKHKSLITHIIVSSHFYINHYHQLQELQKSPILFGITITDKEKDPVILANEIPPSVQYYKYTIGGTITKDHIPRSATLVDLALHQLDAGVIPNRVETLVLSLKSPNSVVTNPRTQVELNYQSIPKSVKVFSWCDYNSKFGNLNINLLPPNLEYLLVNSKIQGDGFGSLKRLSMFCPINQEMITIPNSVSHLKLLSTQKGKYDTAIQLPPNLYFLHIEKLYEEYRQVSQIPDLPLNLKTLRMDRYSNKTITKSNCPPNLLSYRNFNSKEEKEFPYIPPTATKVSICFGKVDNNNLPMIPPSVTDLKIHCRLVNIPQGYFSNNIIKLDLKSDGNLKAGVIPSNVTHLCLNVSASTIPILQDIIPNSVSKLDLKIDDLGVSVPITLPENIRSVAITSNMLHPFNQVVPSNLKTLKLYSLSHPGDFYFHIFDQFPNLSKLCLSVELKDSFSHMFDIVRPNYNNSKFPSTIKQVKFKSQNTGRPSESYHFINDKVYQYNTIVKDSFHMMRKDYL
ncbi:hypothetical protein CYY_005743 [Polysphondylium violaceum]|uniref:FNIP repeat-containing protein n=1 Tax=Polysphondylium violaceum TaxID=133409 RepID=A0A8J4PTS0_9MYCE|nr:hypothetical protein CYY_005743 [Polysphondylium violaceum]